MWTNPYSTQNWGLGTNYLVLPAAATTTYLMLPVPLSSQDNPDVLATIEARYQLVHQRGTVGLYELKSALLAKFPEVKDLDEFRRLGRSPTSSANSLDS